MERGRLARIINKLNARHARFLVWIKRRLRKRGISKNSKIKARGRDNGSATQRRNGMNFREIACFIVLTIIMAIPCAGEDKTSGGRVEFLGEYVDLSSSGDGDHCGGYTVSIWKYKESLIGILNFYAAMCADPPSGIMQDISYSAQTGSLSFKAKLSVGLAEISPPKRSKDLFEFNGTFREGKLEGVMTWTDHNRDVPVLYQQKKITLKDVNLTSFPKGIDKSFETYADWEKYIEPIMEHLGTKW